MEEQKQSGGPKLPRKWLKLVLGLLAAGAIALALWILIVTQRPGEPRYQGKSIRRWIELGGTRRRSPDPEAVNAFGTNAVPYLLEALRRTNGVWDDVQKWFWQRLPASFQQKHPDFRPVDTRTVHENAHAWMNELGPDAKAALPALVELVDSPTERSERGGHLISISVVGVDSPATVPVIISFLKSTNFTDQSAATLVFRRFGGNADAAVPELISILKSHAQGLDYNALLALGYIGPGGASAMPEVLAAFDNPATRNNALVALTGISAGQVTPVSRMSEILRDSSPPSDKMRALQVLLAVGPAGRDALPVLQELTAGTNRMLRVFAAEVGARVEGRPEAALPTLKQELETEGGAPTITWSLSVPYDDIPPQNGLSLRETVIEFLGQIGPPAASAIPKLSECMTNGHDWTRALAVRAVWRIEHNPEHVLPPMKELISKFRAEGSGDEIPVAVVLSTCREMGPAAKPALPSLENYYSARTNSWSRRRDVLSAMKAIQQ